MTDQVSKTCRICRLPKPISEYHFDKSNNRHRATCKVCHREKDAERKRIKYGIGRVVKRRVPKPVPVKKESILKKIVIPTVIKIEGHLYDHLIEEINKGKTVDYSV